MNDDPADLKPEDPDDSGHPRLDEVLKALPLAERDHYFGMQAMNLAIVDGMIEEMEGELYVEYIAEERTPVFNLMRVSALSQLWIFGVYELLRTWRQRTESVLRFQKRVRHMNPEAIEQELAKTQVTPEASFDAFGAPPHRDAFVEAVKSAEYLGVVRDALHRSDLPFRKIRGRASPSYKA